MFGIGMQGGNAQALDSHREFSYFSYHVSVTKILGFYHTGNLQDTDVHMFTVLVHLELLT